jgi:hypothetical protein
MRWRVAEVRALDGSRLHVRFVDGLSGIVDMSALVHSASAGVSAQLAGPTLFAAVRLVPGAVVWPGEIDIAPDAMHAEISSRGTWILG